MDGLIYVHKQVEWDKPGCSDKQNRVSSWEIQTPESLFFFPSLTSGLNRSLHPGFLGKFMLILFSSPVFFSRYSLKLCQEGKLNGELDKKIPYLAS